MNAGRRLAAALLTAALTVGAIGATTAPASAKDTTWPTLTSQTSLADTTWPS